MIRKKIEFLVTIFFLVRTSIISGQLGPRVKIWNKNTNFDNPKNWIGYEGICSQNIYAFPMDMESTVISIPANSTLSTKEIILPRNGHLVFQKGSTILLNLPSETCQGVELKFGRSSRGDWFDPNNWNGNDSLLNSEAIPHVDRVPCQYDSVQFPSESSFHLFISSDVVVHKFFLGEEELNHTTVAFLMSSKLGKIQFQKTIETLINLSNDNWEDNDRHICKNMESYSLRQRICRFVTCRNLDAECTNPITPSGFCCPICGYQLKIQHNGDIRLTPVKVKLDSGIKSLGLNGNAMALSIGRYAQKLAHIVFIPWMNKTVDVEKLIDEIRIFLASDTTVIETTVSKSWDDVRTNKLASSGASSGVTAFIILLVLFLICVTAFLIFLWTKRGYPVVTLNSVLSRLPTIPGMSSSSGSSFSFARFSNERISNINIGATISAEIQQTEKVDTETNPIGLNSPPEIGPDGAGGFINATYDLLDIAGPSIKSLPTLPEDDHIYDLVDVHGDSSAILQASKKEE